MDWEEIYKNKEKPAWDIGKPQQFLIDYLSENHPQVAIDIGCGTGSSTIYMANKGIKTTGVDLSKNAIKQAKIKAGRTKRRPLLMTKDVLKLAYASKFDFAYDSGCFHVIEPEKRKKYASIIYKLLKNHGRLLLLCFSENEPDWGGPHRIKKPELEETFARFKILWINETEFKANDSAVANQFAAHKAYAMLAEKI